MFFGILIFVFVFGGNCIESDFMGGKFCEYLDICVWEWSVWVSVICLLLLFLFYYEYWFNF